MNEQHYHFVVYAYDELDEQGNPKGNVVLDLVADTVSNAQRKAAKLVPLKENYKVVQIIEHLNECS